MKIYRYLSGMGGTGGIVEPERLMLIEDRMRSLASVETADKRMAAGSGCCHSQESFGFGDLQKVAIPSPSVQYKIQKQKGKQTS